MRKEALYRQARTFYRRDPREWISAFKQLFAAHEGGRKLSEAGDHRGLGGAIGQIVTDAAPEVLLARRKVEPTHAVAARPAVSLDRTTEPPADAPEVRRGVVEPHAVRKPLGFKNVPEAHAKMAVFDQRTTYVEDLRSSL